MSAGSKAGPQPHGDAPQPESSRAQRRDAARGRRHDRDVEGLERRRGGLPSSPPLAEESTSYGSRQRRVAARHGATSQPSHTCAPLLSTPNPCTASSGARGRRAPTRVAARRRDRRNRDGDLRQRRRRDGDRWEYRRRGSSQRRRRFEHGRRCGWRRKMRRAGKNNLPQQQCARRQRDRDEHILDATLLGWWCTGRNRCFALARRPRAARAHSRPLTHRPQPLLRPRSATAYCESA